MTAEQTVLERTYAAFNARDIGTAMSVMHPDVIWPNGMEGGTVVGHAAVRAYWTRQWTLIDPRVEPRSFTVEADGRVAVTVHQVVRDLAGAVLKDATVEHVYAFEDGLIKSMEIRA
jgi:ketosteroid isomerase-like protein